MFPKKGKVFSTSQSLICFQTGLVQSLGIVRHWKGAPGKRTGALRFCPRKGRNKSQICTRGTVWCHCTQGWGQCRGKISVHDHLVMQLGGDLGIWPSLVLHSSILHTSPPPLQWSTRWYEYEHFARRAHFPELAHFTHLLGPHSGADLSKWAAGGGGRGTSKITEPGKQHTKCTLPKLHRLSL